MSKVSSLLSRSAQGFRTLFLQAPLALDALGSYVLVAFAPLELTLLHVVMTGALSPTGAPTAKIHAVRELSIMSVGQPVTVREFVSAARIMLL